MKKKGFTLIELLVVIAIIAMLLAILMPALNKVKKIAQRVVCGTNLKGLGTAQVVYANDYDDAFVVQSASYNPTWDTSTTTWASSITPVFETITVGASLYLLVREADVSPKSFVCGAGAEKDYDGQNGPGADITELWDFGGWVATPVVNTPDNGWGSSHGPKSHVSYSYQMPYDANGGAGRHAADGTKSAAFAVMADKNPWMDPKITNAADVVPDTEAANWQEWVALVAWYWANPTAEKWKRQVANAHPHSREGQNVTFGDGHSAYEKLTDVGVKHDGIYTVRLDGTEGGTRRGQDMSGAAIDAARWVPNGTNDSVLVNDDSRGAPY